MAFTAMLLLALIGSSRLKVNLFPDIAFPRISVITPYSNVQAEESCDRFLRKGYPSSM